MVECLKGQGGSVSDWSKNATAPDAPAAPGSIDYDSLPELGKHFPLGE